MIPMSHAPAEEKSLSALIVMRSISVGIGSLMGLPPRTYVEEEESDS